MKDEKDALIAQQAAELERQAGVIKALREQVQAVRDLARGWRDEDDEHLITYGQYAVASLAVLADLVIAALDGGDA